MNDVHYPRTEYEAMLDVDYAIRLAELHSRLFGRLKKSVAVVSLLAGTAAFTSVISHNAVVVGVAALAVSILAILDVVLDFGSVAAAHKADRKRYLSLRRRLSELSLAQIDAELAKLSDDDAHVLESLRRPAYNDNLRRHGRVDALVELSRFERLMSALA